MMLRETPAQPSQLSGSIVDNGDMFVEGCAQWLGRSPIRAKFLIIMPVANFRSHPQRAQSSYWVAYLTRCQRLRACILTRVGRSPVLDPGSSAGCLCHFLMGGKGTLAKPARVHRLIIWVFPSFKSCS